MRVLANQSSIEIDMLTSWPQRWLTCVSFGGMAFTFASLALALAMLTGRPRTSQRSSMGQAVKLDTRDRLALVLLGSPLTNLTLGGLAVWFGFVSLPSFSSTHECTRLVIMGVASQWGVAFSTPLLAIYYALLLAYYNSVSASPFTTQEQARIVGAGRDRQPTNQSEAGAGQDGSAASDATTQRAGLTAQIRQLLSSRWRQRCTDFLCGKDGVFLLVGVVGIMTLTATHLSLKRLLLLTEVDEEYDGGSGGGQGYPSRSFCALFFECPEMFHRQAMGGVFLTSVAVTGVAILFLLRGLERRRSIRRGTVGVVAVEGGSETERAESRLRAFTRPPDEGAHFHHYAAPLPRPRRGFRHPFRPHFDPAGRGDFTSHPVPVDRDDEEGEEGGVRGVHVGRIPGLEQYEEPTRARAITSSQAVDRSSAASNSTFLLLSEGDFYDEERTRHLLQSPPPIEMMPHSRRRNNSPNRIHRFRGYHSSSNLHFPGREPYGSPHQEFRGRGRHIIPNQNSQGSVHHGSPIHQRRRPSYVDGHGSGSVTSSVTVASSHVSRTSARNDVSSCLGCLHVPHTTPGNPNRQSSNQTEHNWHHAPPSLPRDARPQTEPHFLLPPPSSRFPTQSHPSYNPLSPPCAPSMRLNQTYPCVRSHNVPYGASLFRAGEITLSINGNNDDSHRLPDCTSNPTQTSTSYKFNTHTSYEPPSSPRVTPPSSPPIPPSSPSSSPWLNDTPNALQTHPMKQTGESIQTPNLDTQAPGCSSRDAPTSRPLIQPRTRRLNYAYPRNQQQASITEKLNQQPPSSFSASPQNKLSPPLISIPNQQTLPPSFPINQRLFPSTQNHNQEQTPSTYIQNQQPLSSNHTPNQQQQPPSMSAHHTEALPRILNTPHTIPGDHTDRAAHCSNQNADVSSQSSIPGRYSPYEHTPPQRNEQRRSRTPADRGPHVPPQPNERRGNSTLEDREPTASAQRNEQRRRSTLEEPGPHAPPPHIHQPGAARPDDLEEESQDFNSLWESIQRWTLTDLIFPNRQTEANKRRFSHTRVEHVRQDLIPGDPTASAWIDRHPVTPGAVNNTTLTLAQLVTCQIVVVSGVLFVMAYTMLGTYLVLTPGGRALGWGQVKYRFTDTNFQTYLALLLLKACLDSIFCFAALASLSP